jgi:hypothetical protein
LTSGTRRSASHRQHTIGGADILYDAGLQQGDGVGRFGRWSLTDIATDIGGVLKARSRTGTRGQPPASHRLFSHFTFSGGDEDGGTQLGEEDAENDLGEGMIDEAWIGRREGMGNEPTTGGWLEADDIEDF